MSKRKLLSSNDSVFTSSKYPKSLNYFTQDWRTFIPVVLDFLPLMADEYHKKRIVGSDSFDLCLNKSEALCLQDERCMYIRNKKTCVDKRRVEYFLPKQKGRSTQFDNPTKTIAYTVHAAGTFWDDEVVNHNHWKVASCFDLVKDEPMNLVLIAFSSNARSNVRRETERELAALVDLVSSYSSMNYNFVITGHSMGAMFALQFAQLLKLADPRFFEDRCSVVAFGPYRGYYSMDPEFLDCTNVAVFVAIEDGENPDPFFFLQTYDRTGEYFLKPIFFDNDRIFTNLGNIGFDNVFKRHELQNYRTLMLSLLGKLGGRFNAMVDSANNTTLGEYAIAKKNEEDDAERRDFERLRLRMNQQRTNTKSSSAKSASAKSASAKTASAKSARVKSARSKRGGTLRKHRK
jgi:pimeloyl-ACP methyl ester carboxylesterase